MFGGHFAGNVFSSGAAPGSCGKRVRARAIDDMSQPAAQPVAREVFRSGLIDHDLVISGF
jgi:hypothetical protein